MQKLFVISILSLFVLIGSVSAQSKEKTTTKEKNKKECTTTKTVDKESCGDKASKKECGTDKKSKAKSCCSEGETKAHSKKSDDHCKTDGHSKADAGSESYKSFNTVCPVSGMDVKANVKTVSFEGKDYGFCCAGCNEKFSATPEKYSKQLNEDGTSLLKN